jgi:hypothetical protein
MAMLTRALDAGVPAGWVTGDEVYGADPNLRAELETRGVGYVLAVACDHRVVAGGTAIVLMRWLPRSRNGPGNVCPPGAAPRVTACMTGRSSA